MATLSAILGFALLIRPSRRKKRVLQGLLRALFVFTVISAWFLLGWPPVWENPRIPPEIQEAQAAILFVQTANGVTDLGTTVSATFASPPTQDNLLVAIVGTLASVTINEPSGWLTAINESGAPGQAIFYKITGASEPSMVTVSVLAATGLGLHIYEYSGIDTTDPFDLTASASGIGDSVSSGTVTTTQPDELLIAGLVINLNTSFSAWTNSFVERNDFSGLASVVSYGGADLIVSSVGTYSTTATTGGVGVWRGQIATFVQAPPPTPTPTPTDTPTPTSTPTNTPTATATPTSTPTNTPTATTIPTNTPIPPPIPTATPTPDPALLTPTPNPVSQLPATGLGLLETAIGGAILSLLIFISRRLRLAR